MQFTIIGAGAIGGIVGAHLAQAGHTIRFVENNPAHVEAIRRGGFHLHGASEIHIHPEVLLPAEVQPPLRHVLLAVKARHTVQALEPLAKFVAPDGYVVSLQNGLEEYKIGKLVGEGRTIGAFITFGGHYREPGDVWFGGPGSFRVGELNGEITPRLTALRDALSVVQTVETTANIFGFLWAKMALGAVYFATALVSADVPETYSRPDYRVTLGGLAGEVVRVAEAGGVQVESCDGFDPKVFRLHAPGADAEIAATWEGQFRYWRRYQGGRTGVWRDLAQHHRPTEVNEQINSVVEFARERGIAVPRLEALVRLIRAAESSHPLGWHNLDELTTLDRNLRTTGAQSAIP
jgi:2-dehydropantoate 2-reductase